MVSVAPPADKIGPYDDPVSVPQTIGLPDDVVALTRVVPFNDLDALERTLQRYQGRVAGHDRRAGDDERRASSRPTRATWAASRSCCTAPARC